MLFFCGTGRTFPSHPYFSTQLGPGQLSLFNLLKAYSLLDEEVGYCQGLSFIAGILLMHVSIISSANKVGEVNWYCDYHYVSVCARDVSKSYGSILPNYVESYLLGQRIYTILVLIWICA